MINKVVLVGRLTKDPELRKTPNGASTVSYTLACNRKTKAQGQPDADFISCVAWNKTADTMAQYLHKGSLIGVEGRIQTRSYDNQQGNKVYVTEVVTESFSFLESKSNNASANSYNQSYGQPSAQNMNNVEPTHDPDAFGSAYGDEEDVLNIASDDLPF